MSGIDMTAVSRLGEETVDWRFKGLPAQHWGSSVADLAAARSHLFTDGFVGPLVVLDAAALEHNLVTMARWCSERGVLLAPHGKTTMAPQLFARQLELGAWGITAATASQVRTYRAFGVATVMLANQLLDPPALTWLARELESDPAFRLQCWVDSERGVALMDTALRDAAATRPVEVLVELGGGGGRTGARDEQTAMRVAQAVRASPVLRLAGVAGYEGALANDASPSGLAAVDRYLRRLRELTEVLLQLDAFETEGVVVTAGGSAYFDQVVDVLAAPWPDERTVLTVLRSGCYVTHDDGFYRGISPLSRPGAVGPSFRPALRAWARVTSKPEPELALLTMGRRDVSFDLGLPEAQVVRSADGTASLRGCEVTALNDQHCFLRLAPRAPVDVGDWVGCGVSHPCTVFDKWQLVPVVDGETVVDFVRTFF